MKLISPRLPPVYSPPRRTVACGEAGSQEAQLQRVESTSRQRRPATRPHRAAQQRQRTVHTRNQQQQTGAHLVSAPQVPSRRLVAPLRAGAQRLGRSTVRTRLRWCTQQVVSTRFGLSPRLWNCVAAGHTAACRTPNQEAATQAALCITAPHLQPRRQALLQHERRQLLAPPLQPAAQSGGMQYKIMSSHALQTGVQPPRPSTEAGRRPRANLTWPAAPAAAPRPAAQRRPAQRRPPRCPAPSEARCSRRCSA